jgi:uncharacterized protein (TIGR02996 family)
MALATEAFFHALQQDPDSDILRLIYADSLEERGDASAVAHAEFIRLQVELAAPAPLSRAASARVAELTARQAELLAEWEHTWLGGWAEVLQGWTFRRGLVEAVHADASVFLDHAEEWFAEWPTLTVAKLTRVGDHLPELAASPWLAHLRGLDLRNNGIDPNGLAHVTASRFICLLHALDLSDNPIGPGGARLLSSAESADELSELHLARCELGALGIEKLLGWRSPQWRRLDLSSNRLCRSDLVTLAEARAMRHLVALDLASNHLGENGVAALAESPSSAGLAVLGLCDTGTSDGGVAALAASPHLTSLRSLDLRGHGCWPRPDRDGEDWGGIGELSRSPLFARLRRLLLAPSGPSNGWTAEVLSIARPPRRESVTPNCWIGRFLRKSRYLMPSQLLECDLEELWWLGDTQSRERLPSFWGD